MTPQENHEQIWRWSPVGWLPIASYAMLVAYACFAARVVGHWPYYGNPDPKDLPGGVFVKVVTFTTLAGLASVVLIPAAFGFSRLLAAWQKKESLTLQRSAARMYLFGAIVWCIDIGLKSAGRHSLTSWILD